MKIGYVRVSTADQHTARQEDLMKDLNVEKLFIDKCSGKSADRPKLKEMLAFVREGDTVVVESISRLARNTKDLLNIVDQLTEKKVQFISQKEALDTNTPSGRFMLTVFAAMAELERSYINERQREGIAAAKARDGKFGRERLYVSNDFFTEVYNRWKAKDITAVQAAKELKLSKKTFYRRVNDYEKFGDVNRA